LANASGVTTQEKRRLQASMATAEPALPKQAKSGAERPSALFYVLLAAALLIFIQTFALLSPILLSAACPPAESGQTALPGYRDHTPGTAVQFSDTDRSGTFTTPGYQSAKLAVE
jgi:hypothetical protein